MTVVIDLGCVPWEDVVSTSRLIERFHPEKLYGFDPALDQPSRCVYQGCSIVLEPKAAWTYDGFIGFVMNGGRSQVGEMMGPAAVPCFDLAAFLVDTLSEHTGKLILKMDVEGAEYDLLEYLHEGGQDAGIDLLLIEWHAEREGRKEAILETIRCPVETW